MVTDPDLATPNEMMVYAIIDSFSQSKEGWFMGGSPYLMEWTNLSKRSIIRILGALEDKGKIISEPTKTKGCIIAKKYRTNREKSQKKDISHECQIGTRENKTPVQNECQIGSGETPTSDKLAPHGDKLAPHECQIGTQVIQSSNTTSNSISNKDDGRKIEFLVSLLKSMSVNKNGHNNPNIAKDFKHAVKSLTDDLHPHPEFEIVYSWERYQKEREETVSGKKYMPNLATWLENGCVPTVYEKRLSRYWDRKYQKQYERIKSKYPN